MTGQQRPPVRYQSYSLSFFVIASFLILAHSTLLQLPYFWDEAGQFIPAALDIFRFGAWVPVSTLPNVHPPGVMAYLAAVWTLFGYSIATTRIAMLMVASAAALITFLLAIELTRESTGTPAFSALALLCLSPLFFAQSMLAQLDMPAMCLSTLALLMFLQDRFRASAVVCAALILTKETSAIVPALFFCWLIAERRNRDAVWFLLPFMPLFLWLVMLRHATGHWFGNAEFTTYNLRYPLDPVRIAFAILRRFYYLFIGSGHIIGTAALIWAWKRMPLFRTRQWRLAATFVVAHVVLVSVLGGAVLERYLLPALPVVYTAFALSLRALLPRPRRFALAGLLACLIAASFINPCYPFPFENNLSFVSFVQLEQSAAAAVELSTSGLAASTFPVSDALKKPELGFVQTTRKVAEIGSFSRPEIEKLKQLDPAVVVVWNRTWDPLGLLTWPPVRDFLIRKAGYVPELTTAEICDQLSMHVAWKWTRRGQIMEVLQRGPVPPTF